MAAVVLALYVAVMIWLVFKAYDIITFRDVRREMKLKEQLHRLERQGHEIREGQQRTRR